LPSTPPISAPATVPTIRFSSLTGCCRVTGTSSQTSRGTCTVCVTASTASTSA